LQKYVKQNSELDDKGLPLLYNCLEKVDPRTNVVYLDNNALQLMKSFIVAHPKGYIQSFVRSSPSGDPAKSLGGYVYPEPFWKQIFISDINFESFIMKKELSSIAGIKKARNFWDLYKNNDYERLEFEHTDAGYYEDIINHESKETIIRLNTLLDIKTRLERYKNLSNVNRIELDKYFDEVGVLNKEAEEVNLPIALNTKIRKEILSIKEAIRELKLSAKVLSNLIYQFKTDSNKQIADILSSLIYNKIEKSPKHSQRNG
jgi:hypothetical protein